jgi:hypothetical protein
MLVLKLFYKCAILVLHFYGCLFINLVLGAQFWKLFLIVRSILF